MLEWLIAGGVVYLVYRVSQARRGTSLRNPGSNPPVQMNTIRDTVQARPTIITGETNPVPSPILTQSGLEDAALVGGSSSLASIAATSSSPLSPTQRVIATIPSDIGPVPVVADSQTTGNLLNIAQVWLNGASHFAATYRDGSMTEVDATGKNIGPWPPPAVLSAGQTA